MSRFLYPPARILSLCRGLTGFNHIHWPDGFNNTLLSHVGMVGGTYIPMTGKEIGAFDCLGPA